MVFIDKNISELLIFSLTELYVNYLHQVLIFKVFNIKSKKDTIIS